MNIKGMFGLFLTRIFSLCTSPVLDGGSESIIISHTIPDQSATSTSNDSSELLDITFREHRRELFYV
jgi:hypothetical protein